MISYKRNLCLRKLVSYYLLNRKKLNKRFKVTQITKVHHSMIIFVSIFGKSFYGFCFNNDPLNVKNIVKVQFSKTNRDFGLCVSATICRMDCLNIVLIRLFNVEILPSQVLIGSGFIFFYNMNENQFSVLDVSIVG